jgi:hypothetical protein
LEKKTKKREGKLEQKNAKKQKKKRKKEKALWITVVIHCNLGVGEQ